MDQPVVHKFGSSGLFGSSVENMDPDPSTSSEADLLILRWCFTRLEIVREISVVSATCRTTIGSPGMEKSFFVNAAIR